MATKITDWLQRLLGRRKEGSQRPATPPEELDDIALRDEEGAEVRGGAKSFTG